MGLQHIGIVVAADPRDVSPDLGLPARAVQQLGEFGVGIVGDDQSGIGARRQPKTVLNLVNSAFVLRVRGSSDP